MSESGADLGGPSGVYTLVARVRAVVPVKPFALAKQRVRQLSAVRRQALAQLLVRNVVCALHGSGSIGEIVLVGGAEARELAQEFETTWVSDPGLGLNGAVAAGLACCAPEAPRLVVMADLPLLGPDDVRRALLLARAPITLFASMAQTGTNAVLCAGGASMPPLFGGPSLRRHLDWARRQGVLARVVRHSGFALDLDTDEDLSLAVRGGFAFDRESRVGGGA